MKIQTKFIFDVSGAHNTCDNKSKFGGVKISLQKLLRHEYTYRIRVHVQYKTK